MCWHLILTSARLPPSRVMGKPHCNSLLLSTETDGSCGCHTSVCQECHSNLHLPREGKQKTSYTADINYILHSLFGGKKNIVHSDITARKSPCGADFCPTWQNFICMLDNANLLKFYVIRNSLQSHLELLYPFSPKEVFPPHDSFHSMANKRGM